MTSYNEILKRLTLLNEGIKYNELRTDDILCVVITREDQIIFSSWAVLDLYTKSIDTVSKVREELSMNLVLLILRVGLRSQVPQGPKTFENYKKEVFKYAELHTGHKQIELR